jgi:hypothetical protein
MSTPESLLKELWDQYPGMNVQHRLRQLLGDVLGEVVHLNNLSYDEVRDMIENWAVFMRPPWYVERGPGCPETTGSHIFKKGFREWSRKLM